MGCTGTHEKYVACDYYPQRRRCRKLYASLASEKQLPANKEKEDKEKKEKKKTKINIK